MNTAPTVRQLPNIKLSKRIHRLFDAFTARLVEEGLEIGQQVWGRRSITDSRDYILHSWDEIGEVVDIRNFDILVRYADGTVESTGNAYRLVDEAPAEDEDDEHTYTPTAVEKGEAVHQAIKEIAEEGLDKCKSFAELHDHIDANELAGFCDERFGWTIEAMQEVQDTVDKILRERA